jgi:hypothetical protein
MGNRCPGGSKNHHHRRRRRNDDAPVDDFSFVPGSPVLERRSNGRNHRIRDDDDGRHVRSLARVGDTVLRRSRTNPSAFRAHKASTYDHVHALVQGGIVVGGEGGGGGVEVEGEEDRPASVLAGKVGLANLGNTCFVNASLQCLSNTVPLTDYFLGYDYRSEINADNFLGTGGSLASSYAELVKHLWLGNDPSYLPTRFMADLGEQVGFRLFFCLFFGEGGSWTMDGRSNTKRREDGGEVGGEDDE